MITRRLALFRIGASTAVATAAAVPAILESRAQPQAESREPFKHPSEYLAAMLAIGWRPVATFQRIEDGGVHCMGVKESALDEEIILRTWNDFHAIQMRSPVQMPSDCPQGDWWKWVWQHLYNQGLREDVTLPERAIEAAVSEDFA